MIERLQRFITLGLVGISISWLAVCLALGRPLLALAGVVFFLFGHAVVLAVEIALMRLSVRSEAEPVPVWGDLASAWLAEVWCAPRVFCWRQPFHARAWRDDFGPPAGRRGVLLVHGFLCNRALWNGWYPRLRAWQVPHVGISLEPCFGSIDEYVDAIERALDQLVERTGLPPLVVAHSMGGLATRAWLRHRGAAGLERVWRVVTLATPHHGTALVRFGISPNVRQMAPDSPWITSLADTEPQQAAGKFVCLYSRCDNVVFPTRRARLDGARCIEIPACAHVQMVDHPDVFEIVKQILDADEVVSRSDAAPNVA